MRSGTFLLIAAVALVGCDGIRTEGQVTAEEYASLGALQKSDPQAAVVKLKEHLKTKPRNDLLWTILGNTHEILDQDADALAAYRRALEINPRQYQSLTGMGILSRKKGEYDQALKYYEQAISIKPDYAQAYSSMTIISFKKKADAQALEYARKAYDLDKTDPVIVANLAVAYHFNQMPELRDKMVTEAKQMGYKRDLKPIFSGEVSIRD